MGTEDLESSYEMVAPGQSLVVEQVGVGVAQFMEESGKMTGETIAIMLRFWDMNDQGPDNAPPTPYPPDQMKEASYLLTAEAVTQLLILIWEMRDDIERVTGIAHNEGERGET